MANDARSKLRNMGGIMASSPELMEVAQRFQAGGPAAPQPPMVGRAPLPPRPTPGPMSLNRALGSPTRPMAPPSAGLPPTVMRELTGDARERALAGTAPSFGFGSFLSDVPPVPLEEDIGVDDFLEASRVRGGPVEKPTATTAESLESTDFTTLPEVMVGSVPYRVDAAAGRVFRNDGTPVSGREAEMALRAAPDAAYTAERASAASRERSRSNEISNKQQRLERLKETYVQGVPPSSAAKDEVAQLEEEIDAAKEERGEELSAEETVMAQSLVPRELDQATIDKALAAVRDDPNIPFDPGGGGAEDDSEPAGGSAEDGPDPAGGGAEDDPDPGGDGSDTGGPPPKRTKKDLRSRYNEKLELFKEIYGTDDKDEAQDRAMSLAMIGLAIAAGQSPNALTNIAQGAMAGLQGMGARREADRERERGVRTLALETAIGQQEAEAAAEAEAAQANIEQGNKLQLEREKARLDAMYGGTRSSYTPERLRQQAIDKILADPYAYPSLMDEGTQTIDPNKLKAYVDRIVATQSPTAPTAPRLDELTDEERALLGE